MRTASTERGPRAGCRATALVALLVATASTAPAPRAAAAAPAEEAWGPIEVLQRSIAPGDSQRFNFLVEKSYMGSVVDTMVVVTRGTRPGPTLCLTAGIHGDELNGVEIAHRIYAETKPEALRGTLIALPALNVQGLRSGSRYLPDRRDLNRAFPGSRRGSLASRIAHAVFDRIIRHCDALLDLHTGSFHRTNVPQIRTDLADPGAARLATSFGVGVVLEGRGPKGSLRRAALDAGIPAVIYEAGQPLRFEETEIATGVEGVRNVMADLGMSTTRPDTPPRSTVYRRTLWVRADQAGGIFLVSRRLGDRVAKGDTLGTVTDPVTEQQMVITAPMDAVIIGMAVPQMVLPGYGLFHLGTDAQP